MDISVVIVSYNTLELTRDCLLSLKVAAKNLKVEIFVVDNKSHDGSAKMVKDEFPQVKLIANAKNLGFSKANNLALKKAKGKYLLILNPDTKVMPDTLVKMFQFMETNKDVAVSTCRVELPDGSLDPDCRRSFPTPWRALCHFSGLSKLFKGSCIFDQYYMGYENDSRELEIDSCVGAFMMVRGNAAKKIGYFDEDFFFYGEDLDWCFRFKEKGYKIIYTPITKIIHYKGVSSGIKKSTKHLTKATIESQKRALKESTRAMELFYKKHYRKTYSALINFPILAGVKLIEYLRLSKLPAQ